MTRYRPEHFATTEPFLVLFFLFYVAIAVLYALRQSVEVRNYVDAGLVFGTPLVAAGLQSALVRDIEYGMAYSALAMSARSTSCSARILYARHRDDIRLLVEIVPGARRRLRDARRAARTRCALDVGGVGARRRGDRLGRRPPAADDRARFRPAAAARRRRGVHARALAVGAGVGASGDSHREQRVRRRGAGRARGPLSARGCCSAVATAYPGGERDLAAFAFAWGALWWLAAGWREIERWLPRSTCSIPGVRRVPRRDRRRCSPSQNGGCAGRWRACRRCCSCRRCVAIAIAVRCPQLGERRCICSRTAARSPGRLRSRSSSRCFAGSIATTTARGRSRSSLEAWHAGTLLARAAGRGARDWRGRADRSPMATACGARCRGASFRHSGSPPSACSPPAARWPIGAHRRGYLVLGGDSGRRAARALVARGERARRRRSGAACRMCRSSNPLDLTQAIVLVACATVDRARPARGSRRVRRACRAARDRRRVLRARLPLDQRDRAAHDPLLVRRSVHAARAVALDAGAGDAVAAVVRRSRWRRWCTRTGGSGARRGSPARRCSASSSPSCSSSSSRRSARSTRIVSFIGVGLLLLLIGYLAPVPPRTEDHTMMTPSLSIALPRRESRPRRSAVGLRVRRDLATDGRERVLSRRRFPPRSTTASRPPISPICAVQCRRRAGAVRVAAATRRGARTKAGDHPPALSALRRSPARRCRGPHPQHRSQRAGTTSISVATGDGDATDEQTLGGYVLDATALDGTVDALLTSRCRERQCADDASAHRRERRSRRVAHRRRATRCSSTSSTPDAVSSATASSSPRRKPRYLRLSWTLAQPVIEFTAVSGESGDRTVEAPRQWREAVWHAGRGRTKANSTTISAARIRSTASTMKLARSRTRSCRRSSSRAHRRRTRGDRSRRRSSIGCATRRRGRQRAARGRRAWRALLAAAHRPALGRASTRGAARFRVGWQPQELVFATRGAAPFVLAYGNRTATAGALPIATLVPGYDAAKGLPANVGIARQGAPVPLGGTRAAARAARRQALALVGEPRARRDGSGMDGVAAVAGDGRSTRSRDRSAAETRLIANQAVTAPPATPRRRAPAARCPRGRAARSRRAQ